MKQEVLAAYERYRKHVEARLVAESPYSAQVTNVGTGVPWYAYREVIVNGDLVRKDEAILAKAYVEERKESTP